MTVIEKDAAGTQTGVGRVVRVIGPVVDAEFPRDTAIESDPAVKEQGQAELEEVFENWRTENYERLVEALPVDVLDLRSRLNAAFAKTCNSSLVTPKAL